MKRSKVKSSVIKNVKVIRLTCCSNDNRPPPLSGHKSVLGGHYIFIHHLFGMYSFNILTHEWKRYGEKGEPGLSRRNHSFHLIRDQNKLIIFGGIHQVDPNESEIQGGDKLLNDVRFFDLETYSYEKIETKPENKIPVKRCSHSSLVMKGELIIYGGLLESSKRDNDVYRLNIKTKTWSSLTPYVKKDTSKRSRNNFLNNSGPRYMYGNQVMKLNEDEFMVLYGVRSFYMNTEIHIYNIEKGEWRLPVLLNEIHHIPCTRSYFGSLKITNSEYLIYGGENYGNDNSINMIRDMYILDTLSKRWINVDYMKKVKNGSDLTKNSKKNLEEEEEEEERKPEEEDTMLMGVTNSSIQMYNNRLFFFGGGISVNNRSNHMFMMDIPYFYTLFFSSNNYWEKRDEFNEIKGKENNISQIEFYKKPSAFLDVKILCVV